MRSEVGEWLATCVGSPICILLISWTLLIYQNQPSSSKRRIDLLTVAILSESLAHQLALLSYAILTLIRPANHFGEICSTLVWMLNSSSILQGLTLTSIAVFSAVHCDVATLTKNHLKYHLVSMSVISACIGITGVLNFEPDTCVFVAQKISVKYGLFLNSLRGLLFLTSVLGLFLSFYRDACRRPKSELLTSVSDLSDLSSKNSSANFDGPHQNWDPSSVSCTSSSTNSRTCLRRRKGADENNIRSTVYSVLFVCYVFNHVPVLIASVRPDFLRDWCTPQNLATWLPLLQDVLLPISLALFDKMFCCYVAKVYTKQDQSRKMSHGGIDGKFRHFEQDAEYKLQLNLNHGLKFPLTNGSLYGRLHHHQNRGRTGTITMGIQHYPKSQSINEENTYASLPAELTSFTSSTFEPRHDTQTCEKKSGSGQPNSSRIRINENFEFGTRRKMIGSTDVFGQNMENLVQLGTSNDYHFDDLPLRSNNDDKSLQQVQNIIVGLDNLSKLERSLEVRNCNDLHEFPRIPMSRRNQSSKFDIPSRNNSHKESLQQVEKMIVGLDDLSKLERSLEVRKCNELHEFPRMSRSPRNLNSEFNFALRGDNHSESLQQVQKIMVSLDDLSELERSLEVRKCNELHEFPRGRKSRRNQSSEVDTTGGYPALEHDSRTYVKRSNHQPLIGPRQGSANGYDTSDDESCDLDCEDFNDTMSSCRSKSRSCCSVTTVANDDFEFFRRKEPKTEAFTEKSLTETGNSMRTFTPKIIGNSMNDVKPTVHSYHLKNKMAVGYSMNDLDKLNVKKMVPTLSMESLRNILKNSGVSYLDSGEIWRHDIGGSAPDFKKIFVSEFI